MHSAPLHLVSGGNPLADVLGRVVPRPIPDSQPTVRLYPDGRVQWQDNHGQWIAGQCAQRSWSGHHYAVIVVQSPAGKQRLLIDRKRQSPGDFRLLSSWLKLGMPESTEE